jgi:hypothetical protein
MNGKQIIAGNRLTLSVTAYEEKQSVNVTECQAYWLPCEISKQVFQETNILRPHLTHHFWTLKVPFKCMSHTERLVFVNNSFLASMQEDYLRLQTEGVWKQRAKVNI